MKTNALHSQTMSVIENWQVHLTDIKTESRWSCCEFNWCQLHWVMSTWRANSSSAQHWHRFLLPPTFYWIFDAHPCSFRSSRCIYRVANTSEIQIEHLIEVSIHPAVPAAVLGQERQRWELPCCKREEWREWKLVLLDSLHCRSDSQVRQTLGPHIHGNTK